MGTQVRDKRNIVPLFMGFHPLTSTVLQDIFHFMSTHTIISKIASLASGLKNPGAVLSHRALIGKVLNSSLCSVMYSQDRTGAQHAGKHRADVAHPGVKEHWLLFGVCELKQWKEIQDADH